MTIFPHDDAEHALTEISVVTQAVIRKNTSLFYDFFSPYDQGKGMEKDMDEQAETETRQSLFLDWEKHDGNQAPLSEEEIEEVTRELRF